MKNIWKKEEGVSPVIAVILMVAITVVLAAVLYVMVSGMMSTTSTTPTGAMDFTESQTTTGLYNGGFVSLSKTVKIADASVTITDDSTGASASQDPLNPTVMLTAGSGLNLTYYDNNGDEKLDGSDTIRCFNAAVGDQIRFVYRPTGGVVAQYNFRV